MKITSKLTMELTRHCSSPVIHAVQDDKYSRCLELTLLEDGKPWIIPQDATVLIRYRKSDGKGGAYTTLPNESPAWEISDNVLKLTLAPQVLTTPGPVNLSVILMREDVQISTFTIVLNVKGAVHALNGESEEYFHVPGFLPAPDSANVGQFLQVATVDADGHVTRLKAAFLDKNNREILEPEEDDIPKVFFGGPLPQTKDDAIMSFRYISKTEDIRGYCKTKAQGNSSMLYPKKNQTVKLYRDADCTQKLKVDFKGWGMQNKFCFKANWIDLTHARNIVSARLWGDVVKSRVNYDSIPEPLRASPNQGAVDGFPVKVYAEGIYQGRYTINIPKDAWMANMDENLENHCILCGENYNSGCFRAEANIDESDWTDEIHDTVPASIKNRWNEVIRFVMNSTDEEFVAGIGNYFDITSLVDYYLFGLVSCGLDAFGKNQLYMTYDGLKWYASMYDMDSTWGLYWNGKSFVPDTYTRKSYQDFVDGDGNLLYIRLESLFAEAIRTRWEELKKDALSVDNLINRFERFTDIAPAHLVEEDYADTTAGGAFTAMPSVAENNIQQLRNYITKRWSYADGVLSVLGNEYMYRLTEPVTFDGTNYLDTLAKPFTDPKDMTVLISFDSVNEQDITGGTQPAVLTLDGYPEAFSIRSQGAGYWQFRSNNTKHPLQTDTDGSWGHTWGRTKVIVAVFKQGVFTFGKYYLNHTNTVYNIPAAGGTFTQYPDQSILVGMYDPRSSSAKGPWQGTVNDLRIYNRALTEEEAVELIDNIINPDAPEQPSRDPLYPMISESYHYNYYGFTATATNGNHVSIEKTTANETPVNINLHDMSTNVDVFSNNNHVHETIFSLKAGDKVLIKKLNTAIVTENSDFGTSNHTIFFRTGDGSSTSLNCYSDCAVSLDVENEITITSNFNVGSIGFYLSGNAKTAIYKLDFDLEIYVNGVRYV